MKRNVFVHNPELLQEMLSLRRAGWSLTALAIRYQVDHSSIRYWCISANISTPTVITVFKTDEEQRRRMEFEAKNPEEPRKALTYREHVQAYNRRHPEKPLKIPNRDREYVDLPGILMA